MTKTLTAKGIGAPDFIQESREVIYTIDTNILTEFTDALAKNAVERENIAGLQSNRVLISHISVQSVQQLNLQVILYATDAFEESDIALDRFTGTVLFNLPYYGFQQTESQWRMEQDVAIDYEDLDETKELHIVLKNLSPTAKIAGASGYMKLTFHCANKG